MSKRLWISVGVGLLVAGLVVVGTLYTTKGAHLSLDGQILKVRSMPSDERNSIVVVDFRVTNNAATPFMTKDAFITVTTADGKEVEGETIPRSNIDTIFEYYKLLGPKYNQVLIIRDRIAGGKTIDRMVAASFALPESAIASRKAIKLKLDDIDGPSFELTDVPKR